jgi:DnaB helicase-like protein
MADPFIPAPLLRSVIRMGSEPEADLLQNLDALRIEIRPFGIDAHILNFIGSIADRAQRVPDFKTVYSHYTHLGQVSDPNALSGLIRLNEVDQQQLTFLNTAAFRADLDHYRDTITGDTLGELLQQTSTVLTHGWTPSVSGRQLPKTLKGASDAVAYLETGLTLLQARFHSGDIEGSVRLNASEVWDRYAEAKQAAQAGTAAKGVFSGYKEIDDIHDGLLPGDLALVVGFTSHYKSTLCYNWAYHAAVDYGKTVAIIPLEMSAKTLLNMLAVMHCYHPQYEAIYGGAINVRYDHVRRGTLDVLQEQIFREALNDLQTNAAYGHILYKEPQQTTTVGSIKRWAEQQDRKHPLHLLLVDYLGLVNPSSGDNSLRESAVANATLREAKQLCTSFANGRGVSMLSPWQASREGYKEAITQGGQYTLRALSWANEAERSADFVYSVFMDDTLKAQHQLVWGNLKARDREQIAGVHKLYCHPAARVVSHPNINRPTQNPMAASMTP